MITLITGTPGSGKTLWAVSQMGAYVKQGRRLMIDGIKDLSVDHIDVDKAWLLRWFEHVQPQDLIVVDEAQRIWPPTSISQKPTEDVEQLHEHRHRGIDVILITQHPQRISKTLRDLVGRHVHVRRIFGMKRAVIYEWDRCNSLGTYKDAVKTFWAYPRASFKLYTSAEVHTKQKMALPKALYFTPVALVLGLFFAWKFSQDVRGGNKPGSATRPAGSAVGAAQGAHGAAAGGAGVASETWRVAGRYVSYGRQFVVLASPDGVVRLVDADGFKGDGFLTAGEVDGERVAAWTGRVNEVKK
jgi:zona occludens toxin